MLIDDEIPARNRLRHLLGDIADQMPAMVVAEAGDGIAALETIRAGTVDVALVDIRMPGMDGLQLALHLARLPVPPAVIFTTAYDQYAVQAFELSAVDYLLKPVRAERLLAALQKVRPLAPESLSALVPEGRRHLRSTERGRTHLVPVDAVIYLKAEQKYVTARTEKGEYLIEDSLTQLEEEFGPRFFRAHRNCLVALAAVAGYERGGDEPEGDAKWLLRLRGCTERIPVSRRQWPQVKALIST
ncbi:MAG TPA: LytTR family DNA-binding domain-containing protein [Rhodocyclaceae bacterium]|nr:LytTR family DNA-binding domain-containing protein [Rhodocyclaceae bacterium]